MIVLLCIVFFIDIIFSLLALIGFNVQTRGREWYKMEDIKLYKTISGSLFTILMAILYFKYLEPKLESMSKKDKKEIHKIKFSKCPKCKENFTYSELNNGKCKYCEDIETIDMEEYYIKYPEDVKDV